MVLYRDFSRVIANRRCAGVMPPAMRTNPSPIKTTQTIFGNDEAHAEMDVKLFNGSGDSSLVQTNKSLLKRRGRW